MLICAKHGLIEIAKELYERDSNTIHDNRDFGGYSAIQIAVEHNQYEMVEWLIHQGANPNSQDKLGRTPLIEAAENGMLDIIKLLIENEADINAEDREHFGALSYCLDFVDEGKDSDHWECVKYLLENDANPNYVGKHTGDSVLKYAVLRNDMEFIQKLWDQHGFYIDKQVYKRDANGKTVMDYANELEYWNIVEFLMRFELQMERQPVIEIPCIIL